MTTPNQDSEVCVCSLYQFTPFPRYQHYYQSLTNLMKQLDIKGTILLASEGVNGTVAGDESNVDQLVKYVEKMLSTTHINCRKSFHLQPPFLRTKVKLKKEIVTMGELDIDPQQQAGEYLTPRQWNQMLAEENVVIIDVRNDYEVEIGTFVGAINPNQQHFRQFPQYFDQHLSDYKDKKVAMFCTGGIRCEKSTSYLKKKGVNQVYHLQGGILNYLQQIPENESLWQGECFVFDERVAVNHQLKKGKYNQCYACRYPLTQEDMQKKEYVAGQSCHRCHQQLNERQKQRFKEREKQMQLARKRGECHLATNYSTTNNIQKNNPKINKS